MAKLDLGRAKMHGFSWILLGATRVNILNIATYSNRMGDDSANLGVVKDPHSRDRELGATRVAFEDGTILMEWFLLIVRAIRGRHLT